MLDINIALIVFAAYILGTLTGLYMKRKSRRYSIILLKY